MSINNWPMLGLAVLVLVLLLVGLAVWRTRGNRAEGAAGAVGFPSFSRSASESAFGDTKISPSRLARISARPTYDRWSEETFEPDAAEPATSEPVAVPDVQPEYTAFAVPEPAIETAPVPAVTVVDAVPAIDEAALETLVSDAERRAHSDDGAKDHVFVRLVPQVPPRDPILRRSWVGGRPRLPAAMEWPKVDGVDGDFLAQIDCSALPADLWGGLGPRAGSLAFFAAPHGGGASAFHVADDGVPRDPPRPAGAAYFRAYGIRSADVGGLVVQAFPEWPVDLVGVRPGDADPQRADVADADAMLAADFDAGDPAFHPFDWPSMLAMARLLEDRIAALPVDGIPPEDASDELAQAIEDAAATNREALIRTREIIGIIRESAAQGSSFSPTDATAVMAALHSVRWTSISTETDPESGEDMVEATTLPLTRHHAAADLWVADWRAVLFDHLKHAWCANPDRVAAPARAFFEPVWEAMATREMAAMGSASAHPAVGFDDERDVVMLELPSSEVMSRDAGDDGTLVLAIRKTDLAAGNLSALRPLLRH